MVKAEDYVRNCCTFYLILNEKQIDHFFINRGFGLNAITLFLWKRDMEYGNYTNRGYYMNKTTAYDYKFDPDDEILDYIEKINKMLISILYSISLPILRITECKESKPELSFQKHPKFSFQWTI